MYCRSLKAAASLISDATKRGNWAWAKSKEACEKLGRTRVFLNFVQQTIEYLAAHKIKPLFWADIILQGGQEVLDAIPKDAVALNWGYERSEVSEDSCRRLQKTGVPYWNCPGTSVWASGWAEL